MNFLNIRLEIRQTLYIVTVLSRAKQNLCRNMNSLRLYSSKSLQNRYLLRRCYSSTEPVPEDAGDVDYMPEIPEKIVNRDKSGLLTAHRNMLHEQRPYKEPHSWIHQTEKYQRKIFGRYGSQAKIDPRICFPQQSAAKAQTERLKIAEPKSIQVMMKEIQEQERLKREAIMQREEQIAKNMEKLDMWTEELHNKIRKKEADALAAKEKKERLIEEVRRHFGYKVDPKDERFKEMLEQKDREQRKKEKEAKRQAKELKMLTKLTNKEKE